MAQKELRAQIVISGRVDNSVAKMGDQLTLLGSQVEGISDKIIDFGKQSLQTYRGFEDSMLSAEGALAATYGKGTAELKRVMNGLSDAASGWAASTIFHTDDVANAISEAAHAGWDYEQIMASMPAAMQLAQAGSIDLSQGLDYIIKICNATKVPLTDINTLVDQMAYGANSSATDINQMGEAMLRMGATGQFTENTAELVTLLGILANNGSEGAEAGTLLRNSMLRLIAPTKKASDMMNALDVSAEEFAELGMDDGLLARAGELLEQFGFSAYDSTGKLKPFLNIYKELYTATSKMTEQDRNTILSAIFPTRSITGAMAILEGVGSGAADSLYSGIMGRSEGYGGYVSDLMMSGVTGSLETMASKWEEFMRRTGEAVSGDAITGFNIVGGFIDKLNGMSDPQMAGLVGGLEGIAAVGPGLLIAGGGLKLIGTIMGMSPVGKILLAAGAIGALGTAIGKYMAAVDQQNFEGMFGTGGFDGEQVTAYLAGIETDFDELSGTMNRWGEALQTAASGYEELKGSFSKTLLTDMVTGATLTDEQKTTLMGYGEQIVKSLQDGIAVSEAWQSDFLTKLFGGAEKGSEEAQALSGMLAQNGAYYGGLSEQAYQIGETLRGQMVAALEDGTINAEEQKAIDATISRLNEIEARIMDAQNQAQYYTMLNRADNVSWDSASGFITELAGAQAAELAGLDELYYRGLGQQEQSWLAANAGMGHADWLKSSQYAMMREAYTQNRASTTGKYGSIAENTMLGLLNGAGLDGALDIAQLLEGGDLEGAMALYNGMSASDREGMAENLGKLKSAYGRFSEIFGAYKEFESVNAILNAMQNADAFGTTVGSWGTLHEPGDMMTGDEEALLRELGATDADIAELKIGVDEEGMIAEASTAASAAAVAAQGIADQNPVVFNSVIKEPTNELGMTREQARTVGGWYAEGGRATRASVFGEAGPEWAIPESHDARTAQLLNAARAASGFSWGELIAATGGLNASSGRGGGTLVYSPTIYASDASGISSLLKRDKEELARWMRRTKALDEMEVYGA